MRFKVDRASMLSNLRSAPHVPCSEAVRVDRHYEVEIESLDGLINFIKEHGSIILYEPPYEGGSVSLTIYDYYVE